MTHDKNNAREKITTIRKAKSEIWITYSPIIAKNLGSINAAILFTELCRYYEMLSSNEHIFKKNCLEGWFSYSEADIEEKTALTAKEQKISIKILISNKYIKKTINDDRMRYFKFNSEVEGVE